MSQRPAATNDMHNDQLAKAAGTNKTWHFAGDHEIRKQL
jgi:hypothetical protein